MITILHRKESFPHCTVFVCLIKGTGSNATLRILSTKRDYTPIRDFFMIKDILYLPPSLTHCCSSVIITVINCRKGPKSLVLGYSFVLGRHEKWPN